MSHELHYLERQHSRRHDPSPHSLPPLLPGQRRGRLEGLPRSEGQPADGACIRQQSGHGAGRRTVALAGGGGMEGSGTLQGAGSGASTLDDGGVRPAGGGGNQQVHTGHTGQSGKWKFEHTHI